MYIFLSTTYVYKVQWLATTAAVTLPFIRDILHLRINTCHSHHLKSYVFVCWVDSHARRPKPLNNNENETDPKSDVDDPEDSPEWEHVDLHRVTVNAASLLFLTHSGLHDPGTRGESANNNITAEDMSRTYDPQLYTDAPNETIYLMLDRNVTVIILTLRSPGIQTERLSMYD